MAQIIAVACEKTAQEPDGFWLGIIEGQMGPMQRAPQQLQLHAQPGIRRHHHLREEGHVQACHMVAGLTSPTLNLPRPATPTPA